MFIGIDNPAGFYRTKSGLNESGVKKRLK